MVRIVPRPRDAASAAPAATRPSPLAARHRRSPGPVLACGAELKNTFCLARGRPRLRLAPHRRPGELRDAALVHRGHRALPAAVRHRPGGRGARPAPGVPVHQVRARAWTACDADRRPAPPRAHRLLPGRQRRGRARSSGWPSTAPATAPTARSGAASSCVADLAALRARRAPGAGAHAGRRGGDPAAVADGGRLPRRASRRRPDGLQSCAATQDRWPAVVAMAGRGHQRPADLQRGPAVRRGRRRCSASATRSATRARPRSSSSSWPTRPRRGAYPAGRRAARAARSDPRRRPAARGGRRTCGRRPRRR